MNKEILKARVKESKLKQEYSIVMSLLSFSCIARGHTSLMKEKYNFSCSTVGVIGKFKQGRVYINYGNAYNGIEKVLNDNWSNLDSFFKKLRNEALDIIGKMKLDFNPNNPLKSFLKISELYQQYVTILCFYACFWKYVDSTGINTIFRPNLRGRILVDHLNAIRGQAYLIKRIRGLFRELGKSMSIDPDLFRCMTVKEFDTFIKTQSITFQMSQELLLRKQSYYYLYFGDVDQEYILEKDDTDMLAFLDNELRSKHLDVVMGSSAYSGKITGTVFKPTWFNRNVKQGQIIVAKSNIVNSGMINKCGALVIENGGVLDHTAILSREMKKPCILSATGATKIFNNGDKIEVDASNGIAKKIK